MCVWYTYGEKVRCIYDTWIVNIAFYEIDETHGRQEGRSHENKIERMK